ncbi:MAG: hypothetical protein WCD45_07075 [Gallionella sp.]
MKIVTAKNKGSFRSIRALLFTQGLEKTLDDFCTITVFSMLTVI